MIQQSEVVAGAGTIITCPKCRASVATLRKPLYQGWNFGLDILRFEPGQQPDAKLPRAECRKCGEPYSKQSKSLRTGLRTIIHTQFGWLPPEQAPMGSEAPAGSIVRVQ